MFGFWFGMAMILVGVLVFTYKALTENPLDY